jgi:hypothetical protein
MQASEEAAAAAERKAAEFEGVSIEVRASRIQQVFCRTVPV